MWLVQKGIDLCMDNLTWFLMWLLQKLASLVMSLMLKKMLRADDPASMTETIKYIKELNEEVNLHKEIVRKLENEKEKLNAIAVRAREDYEELAKDITACSKQNGEILEKLRVFKADLLARKTAREERLAARAKDDQQKAANIITPNPPEPGDSGPKIN